MAVAVILVDTSVWIDYLRDTDHPSVAALDGLIRSGTDVRVTEPIVMELLAGLVRPGSAHVEALVNGLPLVPLDARQDFHGAADLAVASARNGHPVRSLVDCIIAAVAIRRGVPVLHKDRDFGLIAEISPLRVHRAA